MINVSWEISVDKKDRSKIDKSDLYDLEIPLNDYGFCDFCKSYMGNKVFYETWGDTDLSYQNDIFGQIEEFIEEHPDYIVEVRYLKEGDWGPKKADFSSEGRRDYIGTIVFEEI